MLYREKAIAMVEKPMTAMMDSWEKVKCDDGSIEDVIFIEGKRFYDYDAAADYVALQFMKTGMRSEYAALMAADYMSCISWFNRKGD